MSLIDSFFTREYVVRSWGPGRYKNGEFVEGDEMVRKIRGSLQPATGNDLKIAQEEGERLRQQWVFYSDAPIYTAQVDSLKRAERVIIDDETYKVLNVQHWAGFRVDLPHYKTLLSREPQQ